MNFQIKSLILWSKKPQHKPQIVPFKIGVVNVISGASRTGKSAIVPIIDYCLGSDTCAIPVGIIRENCEWFGIVVKTNEGEKLFARREPGNQISTGDMYLSEAMEVTVPDVITKNITADAVKQKLNQLVGLTSLDFSLSPEIGSFNARPGFRDLAAFLFQAQNVIANPNVLFYKADSYEHQERLRFIIPYVLNALTPDLMAKQYELRELERKLSRAERDLKAYEQASAEFQAKIAGLLTECVELGLIPALPGTTLTANQQLDLLKSTVNKADFRPHPTSKALDEIDKQLIGLKAAEATIGGQLIALRRRHQEMTSLRDSATNYEAALSVQKERLNISKWLLDQRSSEQKCPLCGGAQEPAEAELRGFVTTLAHLEEGAASFEVVPSTLDRELNVVRRDLNARIEELTSIQLQIKEIQERSSDLMQNRFTENNAARFLGRLEANLALIRHATVDSDLQTTIAELKVMIEPLKAAVRAGNIDIKERAAVEAIDNFAGRYIRDLDAEDPNLPIRFQRKDLSLKVVRGDRQDYLWELGSGSNWLSYHIALALAFQRFFLTLPASPVPSFIVMDQPSQVYFPKTLANRPDQDDTDPSFTDADVLAVRKIFMTLSKATIEVPNRLQVIVLDHAAEPVWKGIENIHLVDEWREGKKLVPVEWISSKS